MPPLPPPEAQPQAQPDPILVARGLTKVFTDFWGRPKARAVDQIDFEVRPGEVLALLGPNGAGKSTTLKLILGLLRPSRGQVAVFGHPPDHVPSKSRIGYLPEESYLYRYFTPIEALDFFGKLFALPAQERRLRTSQLLEMVGLSGAQHRSIGEFSKGMQRRLGLAQALINDPDLVILDEPTAGLDPIGCREVKDLILALARRGKTILLSSHLLADVEDVCDRVIIFYGGRIQAQGVLRQLLASPENLRLTLPALPRESVQQLLHFLRHDLRTDRFHLDVPTHNLEHYFLSVVARARDTTTTTSGATAAREIAPYLRGDLPPPVSPATTETPSPDPHRILARLAIQTEPALSDSPTPVPPNPQDAAPSNSPDPARPGLATNPSRLDSLLPPDHRS